MNRWFPLLRRRAALGALLLVASAVGLSGCFRGHGHGRYDPERFSERLDHIQAEIADELEIKPHQQAAFDALMVQYRQLATDWREGWHDTGEQVHRVLQGEPADAAAVGDTLKARVRQRIPDATLERLIDDSVAFYNTLDPEQQQDVVKRVRKHLRRRHG